MDSRLSASVRDTEAVTHFCIGTYVSRLQEIDASGARLGAVLAQRQEDGVIKLIAYASHSLQAHERNYGITELQKDWELFGPSNTLDHTCMATHVMCTQITKLCSILHNHQESWRDREWLSRSDLRILHCSGRGNVQADALSRFPLPVRDSGAGSAEEVVAVLNAKEMDLSTLQRKDKDLALFITYLDTGVLPEDEYQAKTFALTHTSDSRGHPLPC